MQTHAAIPLIHYVFPNGPENDTSVSPLLSRVFPCYPTSSRDDPRTLGGASGIRSGMVGRAGGVGGPRRPLTWTGTAGWTRRAWPHAGGDDPVPGHA
jgi:hypothetical protein